MPYPFRLILCWKQAPCFRLILYWKDCQYSGDSFSGILGRQCQTQTTELRLGPEGAQSELWCLRCSALPGFSLAWLTGRISHAGCFGLLASCPPDFAESLFGLCGTLIGYLPVKIQSLPRDGAEERE